MNYYEARPLADGGGFHFTRRNDDLIHPVGCCADHGPHETREEANECFRQYLLDGAAEESYSDWTGCEVCDAPTKKGLTTRRPLGNSHPLCDAHRTAERLAELTPVPGRISASY